MLKGKSQPVPALRLLDVRARAPGLIRHLDAPMVGRDRELSSLCQAFDRVQREQACHLFTVLGSPGVGKSRLIEEFISVVEEDASVAKGRCLAYGEGITFWPIAEIVRQAAAIHEDDTIAQTQTKIASLLEDKGRRIDLGRRARARAATYSWDRVAELQEQVYLEVVENK